MTAINAGAPSTCPPWNNIDADAMQKQVTRLQMRIAKAVKEGKYGKVTALQWILRFCPILRVKLKMPYFRQS